MSNFTMNNLPTHLTGLKNPNINLNGKMSDDEYAKYGEFNILVKQKWNARLEENPKLSDKLVDQNNYQKLIETCKINPFDFIQNKIENHNIKVICVGNTHGHIKHAKFLTKLLTRLAVKNKKLILAVEQDKNTQETVDDWYKTSEPAYREITRSRDDGKIFEIARDLNVLIHCIDHHTANTRLFYLPDILDTASSEFTDRGMHKRLLILQKRNPEAIIVFYVGQNHVSSHPNIIGRIEHFIPRDQVLIVNQYSSGNYLKSFALPGNFLPKDEHYGYSGFTGGDLSVFHPRTPDRLASKYLYPSNPKSA